MQEPASRRIEMAIRLPRTVLGWAKTIFAALALIVAWYFTAYPRGMLMACIDHARGQYEMKTYGYPFYPEREEYTRLLDERYGVKMHAVAGCVVSEDLVWFADGYNAASVPLLNARNGKDIFEECWRLARQQAGD
jgi:hypothetical protein